MITRIALIPVQIWSDPIWWQFVSDTLPEMVFASAWTVLVTFFVQLVGIATGTGTNTSPELVISTTVRIVNEHVFGRMSFLIILEALFVFCGELTKNFLFCFAFRLL